MATDPDADELAARLYHAVGQIARRTRRLESPGGLTLPERALLSRLDRGGPASAADLARHEQITPQAVGATLNGLMAQGLVQRGPHPLDGRRVLVSLTTSGIEAVGRKRDSRARQFAHVLATEFTAAELRALQRAAPLMDRLAENL